MSINKRTRKVKNVLLIAVVIAFLIAIIAGTYARYTSSGTVSGMGEIAKWHVELGTQDISSQTKTIDVTLTADEESNTNVTSGKIAPGQVLSGTFTVDPTGSEVAIDYLLTIGSMQVAGGTWNADSALSLSKVTALLEDETESTKLTIKDSNAIYFENLTNVTNGKDVTFKVYVAWDNDDANNEADTANGNAITEISIPVTVVARQHIDDGTYTVTFKDGETTLWEKTVVEGETIAKPTDPTKDGYTFINWYSDTELTNVYDFTTTILGDTTIRAKLEPIDYTITYNLDGGIATNPITYTIESDDIILNNPTKNGYYFAGWTGSNGTTPQTDVVIPKGSMGNKTYTANYAQYTQATLRTFNSGDKNVSWSFDSATGIYTITQKAGSSGWGQGVVCDDSTKDINWGQSYMLEFEIYTPNTYTLKTDGNTMFSSNGEGNDIYGTSWVILDGVRYDGALNSSGEGTLPQSHTITGGTWHKVQMYLMNDNTRQNSKHYAIRSFSGFALDLSKVTSNVTYQMRNLKSLVY